MEFTEVKKESFESVMPYLNVMAGKINQFDGLSYTQTDYGIYMICPIGSEFKAFAEQGKQGFMLAKNDGEDIQDFCLLLDNEGNLIKVLFGNTMFYFDDKHNLMQRRDITTGDNDQLAYATLEDGKRILYYTQHNIQTDAVSTQQYLLNVANYSLESFLPYAHEKNPDVVYLVTSSRKLGIPVSRNRYFVKTKDDTYYRAIKVGKKVPRYVGVGGNNGIDLDSILLQYNMHFHIPEEAAEMYGKRDEYIGDIHEVAKEYSKHLLSKK